MQNAVRQAATGNISSEHVRVACRGPWENALAARIRSSTARGLAVSRLSSRAVQYTATTFYPLSVLDYLRCRAYIFPIVINVPIDVSAHAR